MMKEKIMVRLVTQDKHKLQQAALKKRLPLSTYCRYMLLGFLEDEV